MFLTCLLFSMIGHGQTGAETSLSVVVLNESSQPIARAAVRVLNNDRLTKGAATDSSGLARFNDILKGSYTLAISCIGYETRTILLNSPFPERRIVCTLKNSASALKEVTVVAKRQFVEQKQGKIILNVDASPTNAGASVQEVLERSPGISMDKNGRIAMQGKSGVSVLIDGKPTYLSDADLNNLLNSMSSSEIDQIELISCPGAKFDASGNAGVINIRTKKGKIKGANGTYTLSPGVGRYPKFAQNLALNYRTEKFNCFFNYGLNYQQSYSSYYGLRRYFDSSSNLVSTLKQPAYFKRNSMGNTFKTGLDLYVSNRTTIGVVLSATMSDTRYHDTATAIWYGPSNNVDSTVGTISQRRNKFRMLSGDLTLNHSFTPKKELSLGIDLLRYDINAEGDYTNSSAGGGGYTEESKQSVPSKIDILLGNIDYSIQTRDHATVQFGGKLSFSKTDNTSSNQDFDGTKWVEDYEKGDHFVYRENISSVYGSVEKKFDKLTLQAGLRYESTSYNAGQLGNSVQKDSSFSRQYNGVYPTIHAALAVDAFNSILFSMGRRIDRPQFQDLNPFYAIINKYTFATGNPKLQPQDSWNAELSLQHKKLFTTTLSVSEAKNYIAHMFIFDSSGKVLLYLPGNTGKLYTFGVTEIVSASPLQWWTFTAQAMYNYKKFIGKLANVSSPEINQLNININNQLTIAKGYTVEVSGYFITKARVDIQEVLYPTGQVTIGASKAVLKSKATLKIGLRDIFHTSVLEGLTQYPNSNEYFIFHRDTRVLSASLTYRFGRSTQPARSRSIDNSLIKRVDPGGN